MSAKATCRLLIAATLMVGGVGCGGGEAEEQAPRAVRAVHVAPSDATLVRTALLQRRDFSKIWSPAAGSRRERCADDDLFHEVTGRAISDSFSRGNVNVQQSVWLFRDEQAAVKAFAAIDSPSGRMCFRRRLNARIREQQSDIVDPLELTTQVEGNGTRHNRYRAKVSRLVDSPLGPVETFLALSVNDIEHRAGRGISAVVVIAAADEADGAIVRSLNRVAARRLAKVVTG
jgi:hypothetical protein